LINLGILISGRGSNMESILNFLKEGATTNVCPKIVISSKPEQKALKRFQNLKFPQV
jgi:phosphoribosylglycinamide formyltransferase-1